MAKVLRRFFQSATGNYTPSRIHRPLIASDDFALGTHLSVADSDLVSSHHRRPFPPVSAVPFHGGSHLVTSPHLLSSPFSPASDLTPHLRHDLGDFDLDVHRRPFPSCLGGSHLVTSPHLLSSPLSPASDLTDFDLDVGSTDLGLIFPDDSYARQTPAGVYIPTRSELRAFSSGPPSNDYPKFLLDLHLPSTQYWIWLDEHLSGKCSPSFFYSYYFPAILKIHHLRRAFEKDPEPDWFDKSDDAAQFLINDLKHNKILDSMEKWWPQFRGVSSDWRINYATYWLYVLAKHGPKLFLNTRLNYFVSALAMYEPIHHHMLEKMNINQGELVRGNPFLKGIKHARGYLFTIPQLKAAFCVHGVGKLVKIKNGELAGMTLLQYLGLRHLDSQAPMEGHIKFVSPDFEVDENDGGLILWPSELRF